MMSYLVSYSQDFADCISLVQLTCSSILCTSCKLIVRSSGLIRFTFNCLAKPLHRQYIVAALIRTPTFLRKTKGQI